MRIELLFAFLLALNCQAQVFDVTDYGAKGTGEILETGAIQAAIGAAASRGGGTVHFPPGKYLSGTLTIPQAVHLHLAGGSELIASPRLEDYPEITLPGQDRPSRHFLVFSQANSTGISGMGVIDGSGHAFWDSLWNPLPRPTPFIVFENGEDIHLQSVRIQNSPSHTIRFRNCSDVVVDALTIKNPLQSPNTDAIDINDSKNIRISNCYFSSGDDLICLKSQRDTVENITVTNCILESDDSAIKFGTGSRVATRYCTFNNIIIRNSRYGIALFMLDGGVFEHCRFSDITIETGGRSAHHYPIYVDIDRRTANSTLGSVQHITFENIHAITEGKILVSGNPQSPAQFLLFKNITIVQPKMGDFTDARKPRGNKNYPATDQSVDLSRTAAAAVFGHLNHSVFESISIYNRAENQFLQPEFIHTTPTH